MWAEAVRWPADPLDPLELLFYGGWLIYVVTRGAFERKASREPRRIDRRRTDVLRLIPVGIGSLLLPILYAITNLLQGFDYALPIAGRSAGVPVLAVALILFWRSHADLGAAWSASLEVRERQVLVQRGVYARVRHPMYSAILLVCLAQGLLLNNWLAGWSALAAFMLLLAARVPREERMMQDAFGESYERYAARTGRFWPRRRTVATDGP